MANPRSFVAFFLRFAMEGAMNPKIISGMLKKMIWLRVFFTTTITVMRDSVASRPSTKPSRTEMSN